MASFGENEQNGHSDENDPLRDVAAIEIAELATPLASAERPAAWAIPMKTGELASPMGSAEFPTDGVIPGGTSTLSSYRVRGAPPQWLRPNGIWRGRHCDRGRIAPTQRFRSRGTESSRRNLRFFSIYLDFI